MYLEVGSKRTFASAVDWPGWSRSGRYEAAALEAFVGHGPRYRSAMAEAASELVLPTTVDELEVVERLPGNSGTDLGVPTLGGSADERPVDDETLRRLTRLLRAAWAAFDRAAEAAVGVELRKGPRGGGRELDRIVDHVLEAERSYLGEIGGRLAEPGASPAATMALIRDAAVETLGARARGEEPPPSPRRTRPFWTPRYFVRRSAWHALDHAWEIEDRSIR